MVLAALRRIYRPQYRVTLELPSGEIHLQRQGFFGRWHYVTDSLGAVEFCKVVHAFAFADTLHDVRKYDIHLLITFEEE